MGKTTDAARGSVSSAVFESLKSAILGGAWPTGSKIPSENMLAKQMEEAKSTDEMAEYDLKSHALVAKSTGNPIFVRIFDVLSNTYRTLMKGNVEIVGTSGVSYHYMIAYALEARDGGLARLLMERHLDQTMIGTGEYKGSGD